MKLYVDELHSAWTRQLVQSASQCLVSEITWAEMCAALAFKARTQQIGIGQVSPAVDRLRAEWAGYLRLAVDSALVFDAGELAMRFGLRAFDSVQLAAARKAREIVGDALQFCCFDHQLSQAARTLGLHTPTP